MKLGQCRLSKGVMHLRHSCVALRPREFYFFVCGVARLAGGLNKQLTIESQDTLLRGGASSAGHFPKNLNVRPTVTVIGYPGVPWMRAITGSPGRSLDPPKF